MAYEWTQIGYWNKPNLSWTIYLILAVCVGFFGIDHLYMRSPFTAFLKFIVNLMTLGFWYFYDIVNAFTEGDLVKEYGVGTPFVQTGGIGAGMFADEPDKEHAPWTFMGYSLASGFPFGLFGVDNFIAGDKKGGFAKLWMTLLFCFPLILLAPLGWILGIGLVFYGLYVLFFDTESLFSKGVPSPFGRHPSTLGPSMPKEVESSGFFGATFKWLFGLLKGLPVIGPMIKDAESKAELAMAAAQTIKASTVDVAFAGAQAAKTLAVDVPMQATKAVAAINDGIQKKIAALPSPMEIAQKKINGAVSKVSEHVNSATKAAAAPLAMASNVAIAATNPAMATSKLLTKGMGSRSLMKGGAVESNSIASMALMGVLYGGLVLAIGNFLYIQYKKTKEDKKVLEGYARVMNVKTGSKHESTLSDVPPMM
jgi:hypothetical protein